MARNNGDDKKRMNPGLVLFLLLLIGSLVANQIPDYRQFVPYIMFAAVLVGIATIILSIRDAIRNAAERKHTREILKQLEEQEKLSAQSEVAAPASSLQYEQQELKLASINAELADQEKLLAEARESAKTEAFRQVEAEYLQYSSQLSDLKKEVLDAVAKRDKLLLANQEAEKRLATVVRRSERLQPLAKSIQSAFDKWVVGDTSDAAHVIDNLDLEELLPEPELNCLTMNALNSRYRALRKQIVELCKAYESRYTTKVNATLYKLMVLALEAELESVLYKLRFGQLDRAIDAVKRLTEKYYSLAAEGNQSIAPSLRSFIGQIESLYLDVVATEYEYYVQHERAKEEQRALREQMRQEAEERKQLELEKKKVEAEERKYQQEIERIKLEMNTAKDAEVEALRKRLEEMTALMGKVEERKLEIVNLQNGKAGTVYVISNIGSFGDDVFKIGMTRRLEPEDRVNELSGASVPFPFDVHSFIFSEDAPALEAALHRELNDRRINKVNLRKEFFRVSIEELQHLVEKHDPTAPFRVTALAEQYRQSLSIIDVPVDLPKETFDEDE